MMNTQLTLCPYQQKDELEFETVKYNVHFQKTWSPLIFMTHLSRNENNLLHILVLSALGHDYNSVKVHSDSENAWFDSRKATNQHKSRCLKCLKSLKHNEAGFLSLAQAAILFQSKRVWLIAWRLQWKSRMSNAFDSWLELLRWISISLHYAVLSLGASERVGVHIHAFYNSHALGSDASVDVLSPVLVKKPQLFYTVCKNNISYHMLRIAKLLGIWSLWSMT